MASIKYKDNGEYKDIVVKVGDTSPIGLVADYDGSVVPNGWEQVDDPNEYSTTEQVVGKWINGKNIYRKCYEFTTLANFYNIESGKEQIISITGIIQRKDYTDIFVPVNGRANETAWATSFGNIQLGSTNRIVFNYGESWNSTTFNKLTIILEYTKTTD